MFYFFFFFLSNVLGKCVTISAVYRLCFVLFLSFFFREARDWRLRRLIRLKLIGLLAVRCGDL